MKPESPVAREMSAMFALLTAFVWAAYVLTRPEEVSNWVAHPATAAGIWLFLFPFRQGTAVRRGVWLALALIGVWIASRLSVVWIPFAAAAVAAYLLRFLSRALQSIPLPGGRALRVPRRLAHVILALFFSAFGMFLAFGVAPSFAQQTAQLAEGVGVAYRKAFLHRVETVPLGSVRVESESPSRLGGDVSGFGKTWRDGDLLTPDALREMKSAGVSAVPVRTEPLAAEWHRDAAWLRAANEFLERVLGPDFAVEMRSTLQGKLGSLSEGATTAVGWLFDMSGRLLSSAFGLLMTLIFTAIILAYGAPALDRYIAGFFALFPEAKRERARSVARRIDSDLQAFLRGQFVVVLAVAGLSTLAYGLAGIPFPLVVGIMGGLLNMIPNLGVFMVGFFAVGALVFGTAVGMEPPILFVIYVDGFNGFLLRLALIPAAVEAVQLLDNSFISPRIMSHAINVDPLLVMFSVLLGGTLFGFWGVLLALPCVVVVRATRVALRAEPPRTGA